MKRKEKTSRVLQKPKREPIEYVERVEPYGTTPWPNDVDPVVE
jgi:hypothetical protein